MIIPPIKSQGIKTKLVTHINEIIKADNVSLNGNWIEPFFGTGVVGFNSPLKGKRIVGDTNPHIINFYKNIQNGNINEITTRQYLEDAHIKLSTAPEEGYAYYRAVRDRFNTTFDSLDFLFLSRAGFNGMMRFNKLGKWNIPFCKKKERFAPAYITKICNQVKAVRIAIENYDWTFRCTSFENIIQQAHEGDTIYSDAPYFGLSSDYYNQWAEKDEKTLCNLLCQSRAKVIVSTWYHNSYRKNPLIESLWEAHNFNIYTQEHFYHSGGSIEHRHPVTEALICNFKI